MAEDTFKNLLIGFILFSLIGMLVLTAVNTSGGHYSKDMSEVAGGSLNLQVFNNTISGVQSTSEKFQDRFTKGNVWSAIAGVVVEGIFGIARDMIALVISPFTILSNIMTNVLQIPAFVSSVILGVLIISIIFAVWRLIKIGD